MSDQAISKEKESATVVPPIVCGPQAATRDPQPPYKSKLLADPDESLKATGGEKEEDSKPTP